MMSNRRRATDVVVWTLVGDVPMESWAGVPKMRVRLAPACARGKGRGGGSSGGQKRAC